jgi:hypothetical protein
MEVVCEGGFGYHMGGVLGSSIAKEFGTWEYVTGMTGRSWMEKRGVDGHEVAMSDLRDFVRRQIASCDPDLISCLMKTTYYVFDHE